MNISTWIIVFALLVIGGGFVERFVVGFWGRGKLAKTEAPVDWMQLAYKNWKRSARLGRREVRGKLLVTGEGDIVPATYRYTGLVPGESIVSIFWKPRFWMWSIWVLCPAGIIHSLNTKNIRIRARSFRPLDDMFWVPVFCVTDKAKIDYYMEEIHKFKKQIADYMATTISMQNRLNSIATGPKTELINLQTLKNLSGGLGSQEGQPGLEASREGKD